jgi:hypothetical protein
MSATVLPELTRESVETAERLGWLSAKEDLDFAEAEYLLASGLNSIQRVPRLWPIVRDRVGRGMMGPVAHQLLTRLLDAVDKNLSLAGTLKEPSRIVGEELGQEPDAAGSLTAAQEQLLKVRTEAVRLLKAVEAPAQWPGEEQLQQAREEIQHGSRLSAEELRQALLEE